jgi:ribosome maturation factor RimP
MNTESQIRAIEQKVTALIESDPETFLVDVKINPGNNVKVFVDADHGVNIDKLAHYNRYLHRQIEESGVFSNDDFSLEVSSPGLDEPLKLQRQYAKNTGRSVEVIMKTGLKKEGMLVSVADNGIVLAEQRGSGKRREVIQCAIPYVEIKTTKVQAQF